MPQSPVKNGDSEGTKFTSGAYGGRDPNRTQAQWDSVYLMVVRNNWKEKDTRTDAEIKETYVLDSLARVREKRLDEKAKKAYEERLPVRLNVGKR